MLIPWNSRELDKPYDEMDDHEKAQADYEDALLERAERDRDWG